MFVCYSIIYIWGGFQNNTSIIHILLVIAILEKFKRFIEKKIICIFGAQIIFCPSLYSGKCKQSDNDLLFCRVALAKASLYLFFKPRFN